VDELIALFSGNRPESFWLYLGLMSALAIFGLIQSNQGKAVIFANYTDVLCTILALVLPIALLWAIDDRNLPQTARAAVFFIPILFVAKATFSYNQSIFGFLLSLFTKFFLVIVYILALVVVIALALGGKRAKGQHQSTYSTGQKAKAVAGAAGVTGVFAILVKLGLHSPGFVSLGQYRKGK
jgi:uncharacterized membrane protein